MYQTNAVRLSSFALSLSKGEWASTSSARTANRTVLGIDLHSGHIFANVEDRHRSAEFIGLLKQLDEHYPPEAIIRVVLDNHSAHISKETPLCQTSCRL